MRRRNSAYRYPPFIGHPLYKVRSADMFRLEDVKSLIPQLENFSARRPHCTYRLGLVRNMYVIYEDNGDEIQVQLEL
jgi:hypothetical protein